MDNLLVQIQKEFFFRLKEKIEWNTKDIKKLYKQVVKDLTPKFGEEFSS